MQFTICSNMLEVCMPGMHVYLQEEEDDHSRVARDAAPDVTVLQAARAISASLVPLQTLVAT